ncbi:MAG: S-formylglutathione hydrolase [Salipiger thiooxidans]|jgi:S-formylglutathione hydrolase|uniref:S-formylglutathione hydrolase n=1 Tax=Salipiger thiooxidans TaxID=282683 RepID=UPI001A901562|nr:S-formylglutathione hydrolase [Salipiger thiooxidans]MBN8188296.1 S-formylglutathione hydrolase [Salipiger thiooxidans]MBR9838798.1 S-formylglutathione hydrolase [Paracoccaceae bacterium]MCA0848744.1 S-formylglutathione hydrolase [Salipiger thiooxidans]
MEIVSENRSFGGTQGVYRHASETCDCDMTFAVYLPPQAKDGPVPVLWYLSGLTCTHENAMTKGGFQEHAAKHGLAVVFPDTSPRGEGVANDEAYDLGQGAGFYVNAKRDPWKPHYRMYDYVVSELRGIVSGMDGIGDRHGITGHSMGGHGALTIAMRNPELYDSLSAFAPIAHPTQSDWGRKQLSAYLGDDEGCWAEHDSTLLLEEHGWKSDILVDQGASDQFLDLLKPEALAAAIAKRRQPGTVRMQAGYDHSYFFVNSFAGDHVAWHAERLK